MAQPEIDVAAHTDEALRPAAASDSACTSRPRSTLAPWTRRGVCWSQRSKLSVFTHAVTMKAWNSTLPFILARSGETAAAQWGRADEGRDERLDVLPPRWSLLRSEQASRAFGSFLRWHGLLLSGTLVYHSDSCGSPAETATERVAQARVARWRAEHGLTAANAFAFAFAAYDEAVAHGGRHVATAWLRVRARVLAEGLPASTAGAETSTFPPERWEIQMLRFANKHSTPTL